MIAWRACKTRHDPLDPTGARLYGGRWNAPGTAVLYAADSFAGALLEILAHTLRPRTLPGPHHAVRLDIPDDLIEALEPGALPDWEARESGSAVNYGNSWCEQGRSAALAVPALPARPIGRILVINLAHPDAARIGRGAPFSVPWDERLL